MSSAPVYMVPDRLKQYFTQKQYKDWLTRKARPHRKRDNLRWGTQHTLEAYKLAIHKAVLNSNDLDPYTGEKLDWTCRYVNEDSQKGKLSYRNKTRNLPTVDHKDPESRVPDFELISWIVNSAKHDLTKEQFLDLCKKVVDKNSSK